MARRMGGPMGLLLAERSVAVANQDAGPVEEPRERARAAGATKPGLIARVIERSREAVQSIRLPRADWRTFGWGLLFLIVLAFIAANWAPVRVSFFGWYLDAPRAVVFVTIFLLGMLAAWLLEVRSRRAQVAAEEAAEAARAAEEAAAGEGEDADDEVLLDAELPEMDLTDDKDAI